MFNINSYINQKLDKVEYYFRVHNQPTSIYIQSKLLKVFGTNEGGPSYQIYVDDTGKVLDIKENNILDNIFNKK